MARITFNEIDAQLLLDSMEFLVEEEHNEDLEEAWKIIERLRNFLDKD